MPSVDDLLGDIEEDVDGYIATPSGRLWVNDAEEEFSFLMCRPGCVSADPNNRRCAALGPQDDYAVEELQDRADADTGEC